MRVAMLDRHTSSATAPATWTDEWVRERLRQAFEVEARMPGDRRNGMGGWPLPVVHEFSEMIGWDDARERVWDQWRRAKGVYPFEVSRMDEAFSWVTTILRGHEGEARCLMAWAFATARGRSVRRIVAKRGWSRATFYRRVVEASQRIATALNARGVQVR